MTRWQSSSICTAGASSCIVVSNQNIYKVLFHTAFVGICSVVVVAFDEKLIVYDACRFRERFTITGCILQPLFCCFCHFMNILLLYYYLCLQS